MLCSRSILIRDYICNHGSSLFTSIVIVILIHGSVGQDISFPDENSTKEIQQINLTSTMPKIECGENMIMEELNGTENFCECIEGYLYHRMSDKCYKQYTKGPCHDGEHFILQTNKIMAKCVRNPCKVDNEVQYKGSCHGLLLSGGPCSPNETLIISEKLNKPVCESIDTVTYQVITVPIKPCGPGSRRAGRGLCRTIL